MALQSIRVAPQTHVKSGEKILIYVIPIGIKLQKFDRMMLFTVAEGGGQIDRNGNFTAPVVYGAKAESKVKIVSIADPTITAETVITINPVTIEGVLAPPSMQAKAGSRVKIPAKAIGGGDYERGLIFSVERGDGEVDSDGYYYAPVSATDPTATVRVTSAFDKNQFADVEISIKAIKIKGIEVQKPLEVKSGKPLQIHAKAIGDVKEVRFSMESGEGEVSASGLFTAPPTLKPLTSKVRVTSEFDSTVSEIVEIKTIEIKPMKIKPSDNLNFLAGQEKTFTTDFELPKVDIYWRIIDFGRDTGNIDPITGKYKAPDVVPTLKTIRIEAIDQLRPNNKAQVEITLLPVEMKALTQRKIHAGEKDVELAIESHNDLSGLYNFTCAIVSHPMVGRITEDNKYTPPLVIDSPETVKVKATSKLDKSKSVILKFEIDLPLCRACKGITNSVGRCTICDMPRSYGASL